MASEERQLQLTTEWAAQDMVERPRHRPGMGLTVNERKVLLLIIDLLLVNATLLFAVSCWTEFTPSWETLLGYGKWFVTLSLVWLFFAIAFDLYDPMQAGSTTYSVMNTGLTAFLVGGAYWAIPWFTPPPERRLLVLGFIALMVLAVTGWRVLYARLFYQPSFRRRVLLMGDSPVARRLSDVLDAAADTERANPFRGTGYGVLGTSATLLKEQDTETLLDPAHALVRLVRTQNVQEILISDPGTLTSAEQEALLDCKELGIPISTLTATYERLTGRLPVEYAERDLDLILSNDDSPIQRLYEFSKRLFDIGFGLLGLPVLAVAMPLVALGNALTSSSGSLFYRQQRVGKGGRPFTLVKFRTMTPEAEAESGAVWAAEDDPRITPLGRLMRKTRIDELPQFLNVLTGEMSAIGPRPERPQFVGEISRALPIYRARHAVKPGITGWAQVRYRYGNSVEDARIKLEHDLYYVKHAGFWLDTLILLQTVPVMLRFQGH